jgi:hypothetical protein
MMAITTSNSIKVNPCVVGLIAEAEANRSFVFIASKYSGSL